MSADLAIVGGGQLGCMLHAAATRAGMAVCIGDIDAACPAAELSGFRHADDWAGVIAALAAEAEVLTWEREDLPPAAFADCAERTAPSTAVLARLQDRLGQKRLLDELGVAQAAWRPAEAGCDPATIAAELGLPAMVKARRGGFDGRGQELVDDADGLAAALARFAGTGAIVEEAVPFDEEFAVLVTRDRAGHLATYPPVRTQQVDGQLLWSLAPAPLPAALTAWAGDVAAAIAAGMDHVGTLAVECFRVGDRGLVNEIAPRVHNSGHWSLDSCAGDQFTNHVRAVCGHPLIAPDCRGLALMLNCLGSMPEEELPAGWRRYDYRKAERPRRKVGHLTVQAADAAALAAELAAMPGTLRERFAPSLPDYLAKLTTQS